MSIITSALVLLLVLPIVASFLKPNKSKKNGNQAPGPKPWPLIGNLFFIGKFRDVTEAFSVLARDFGNTVFIKLGVFDTIVVSGWKNIKNVLITNGQLFEARPNFSRYSLLFGDDKSNSLAFCDGSEEHYKNRATIIGHTFVKNGSLLFENLNTATTEYIFNFMEEMKAHVKSDNKVDIKSRMGEVIAAVFLKYFCSIESDMEDPLFKTMVESYDDVFQEVNEGCVGDVLPSLMVFINKTRLRNFGHSIREFVVKRCVEPLVAVRQNAKGLNKPDENNNCKRDKNNTESDLPNNLLNSFLDATEQPNGISLDHALFSFEDMLGGHSAISNVLVRTIYYLAKNPEVQQKIREEVSERASGFPSMTDRLTYTEATVWEAMRFVSSSIVPHVATEDCSIDDFSVKQGTIVMFNTYDLNFSSELWESPDKFIPERFISKEGHILKPNYFIPFSTGRRSCLGYKLLINIATVVVANLCQNFEIDVDPSVNYNFARGVIAVGKSPIPYIYKLIDSN